MHSKPPIVHRRVRRPVNAMLRCLVGFGLAASLIAHAQPGPGAPSLPAQAASASATGMAMAPGTPRPIPVNVQGVASLGLTVRVKEILIGTDATVLTVNVSFSSRMTHNTELASTDTFLELANGDRLPVKRPDDNRYLKIREGETMQGQLVFLGALPPSASEVKLVFNDGNEPDDAIGPGLQMRLPLNKAPESR